MLDTLLETFKKTRALRVRAAHHGRSTEAEIRD
ncbi:FitA-like ribbon-helix-helix domain-containing protein, partial [Rhizobium leguminosarum]